ncbi:MAG: hypothetical protein IT431_08485 [Phycisphaerales bacterium]|nr:hypothetical protein [Phycisphaerales bacterium]
MSSQARVAKRVEGMERAARVALEGLEAAFESWSAGDGGLHAPDIRLLGEAEARVFEYRRQVLVVEDVLPDAPAAGTLRGSMSALADALDEGVRALRDAPDSGPAPWAERASAGLERVTRDAEALLRELERAPDGASGG